jgi:hypothetical protein
MLIRVGIPLFKVPTVCGRKVMLGNVPSRYTRNFLLVLYIIDKQPETLECKPTLFDKLKSKGFKFQPFNQCWAGKYFTLIHPCAYNKVNTYPRIVIWQ